MRILASEADIAEGLKHLRKADPRLRAVIKTAGEVPLRRSEGGFTGIARIVVSQQLSSASANAIWRKVEAAFPTLARTIAKASDEKLRACGLSGGKMKTLRAVAAAALEGLDLDGLAQRPAEEAHAALTAIHGIGPWTADIYLLFCLGHPDIMPAGDLALRIAVGTGLGLPAPPSVAELTTIAEQWSPWRSVAAFTFWAYYHRLRDRR